MLYHCILASIIVALTWVLSCILLPAWPAFALVWVSVLIFTVSVLILFAGFILLSTQVKDERRKNPSAMYPLSGYAVFCFFAIFLSLLLSSYSWLFVLHLFGIFLACIIGFVMRSAWQKSTRFALEHKDDQRIALKRAENLSAICSTLKMKQLPDISSQISKVHLFSEKLRYAAGAVDVECDAELDSLISELTTLVDDTANGAELQDKLPVLLQKMENVLSRRERLAIL